MIRPTELGLSLLPRDGWRSAAMAVACGLGFGAAMAAADASVFHAAVPDVQRALAGWPLGPRLGRFLIGAVHDELLLRLVGLTTLVWIMAVLHGRPEPRHRVWAIGLTAAVLWPLSASTYLAGLDWSGLTLAREVVLHGGAGLLWGWLYCRHGWVAGVLGHGCAHLALQPVLAAVTL